VKEAIVARLTMSLASLRYTIRWQYVFGPPCAATRSLTC
jgi:hypothetical protein